ncbi:MAG: glycine cleavage system aminomethyltransferase GcvT [Deltaproteobacteria bacterium]
MAELQRTVLYDRHLTLGANMVEFGGYEMPVYYPEGIIKEHLATRKGAGLFDVSHMGRFIVGGENALDFLQHVLTNNAQALDKPETGSQYTFIPNETGGAVDDAYLYRFSEDEYMLVINASSRLKDWEYFQTHLSQFNGVTLTDRSDEIAMIALQGPSSRMILKKLIHSGRLPEPSRNAVSKATINGSTVKIARTGYTGEPLGFELFVENEEAPPLWDQLVAEGATPAGLGARDTLRLEAGLPLYGHELGRDPEDKEIPIFACPLAKFSVSFSDLKKNFIGRKELAKQHEAFKKIMYRDFSSIDILPRMIYPVAIAGRGIGRQGDKVYKEGRHVGYVTSGTMVPFWEFKGTELSSKPADDTKKRSICLAYLESDILEDEALTIEIRKKQVDAIVTPYHIRSESPPFARPILFDHGTVQRQLKSGNRESKAIELLKKAVANTHWRQLECINLIPSEMTVSPLVRLLSVMDPSFRYAEHKKLKAFYDAEIFYYQGTDFIDEVEVLLVKELKAYLGCAEVETRLISGQMANAAIFSAMVDYINRADRKSEPRRIRKVMNNHIGKGGHLSSQPMGALRDFVARDPSTERPAVINFPVLEENLYQIDVAATLKLIDDHRPELIIFGKSMVITKEPVKEVRQFIDDQGIDAVLMYDMAHVLGLIGPYFQEPFIEGADLVSGSTHKTYFGTQRGIVGSQYLEDESFSASGALRMGVAEMTRFGMETADFEQLAQYIFDVIAHNKIVKEEIIRLRSRFLELQYCFSGEDFNKGLHKMAAFIDRSLD